MQDSGQLCKGLWCLTLSGFLLAGIPANMVWGGFTDVTAAAGITYVQSSNPMGLLAMTGGAAARDYDGDGWTDLVVTRLDDHPILYRNLGNGTFVDASAAAGLNFITAPSNGASWGDVNNDGYPDLYLTTLAIEQNEHHYLLMNNGDGTFSDEAVARGAAVQGPTTYRYGTSAAFGDYDGDGWLDIHTNEWGNTQVNPAEVRSNARLLRNNGAAGPGTFTDVTLAAGVSLDNQYGTAPITDPGEGVWSFSSRFSDLDRDGHADLVVASDFNTSRLYWNNGDGTFSDGTSSAGVGTDENGMGLTVGDYNRDGQFDVFVTSIFHPDPPNQGHNLGGNHGTSGNRLFLNNGDRSFTDATEVAGVRDGSWGWGASFLDYDHDGDLDLAMTNGFNAPELDFYTDSSRLWNNAGNATFADVSVAAGIIDIGEGKGLLTFDYDNDGDLDLLVVNNGDQPVLYRNDGGNQLPWLKLELTGTVSNRDAVGAIITVTPGEGLPPMVWEIDGGSNYLSQNDIVAHFGLGELSGPVESISILWPDGSTQRYHGVQPNQTLHIVQRVPGCDFDGGGSCEVDDLNALLAAGPIADGVLVTIGVSDQFDMNGDGTLDLDDRDLWLAEAATQNGFASSYNLGDANLDGIVDGQDFLAWNAAKFTASLLWSAGDFNGDGIIDGQDFLVWNANKFTSSNPASVPEPAARLLSTLVLVLLALPRTRH